jgi:CBS domain-containing protein
VPLVTPARCLQTTFFACLALVKEDRVMKVKEIMSADPACCEPVSTVEEAARLMAERDCGEIPVVDSGVSR